MWNAFVGNGLVLFQSRKSLELVHLFGVHFSVRSPEEGYFWKACHRGRQLGGEVPVGNGNPLYYMFTLGIGECFYYKVKAFGEYYTGVSE